MSSDPRILVSRSGDHTLVVLLGEVDAAIARVCERALDVVATWARPVDVDLSE